MMRSHWITTSKSSDSRHRKGYSRFWCRFLSTFGGVTMAQLRVSLRIKPFEAKEVDSDAAVTSSCVTRLECCVLTGYVRG